MGGNVRCRDQPRVAQKPNVVLDLTLGVIAANLHLAWSEPARMLLHLEQDLANQVHVPLHGTSVSSAGAGSDLLKGYVNLNIAAGCGRIDRFNDALNVGAKSRPLLLAENRNRDHTNRKVLLIAHVLVGCQQDVESRFFRHGQPVASQSPFLS